LSVVYHWITQIIMLIMLAIVLEMLLPNDSFKRYVHMVIGLVLIVALLSPIMKLFNTPAEEILKSIHLPQQEDPLKKSINDNKKVIESNLTSYIQQQTAVQMKNYVQKELMARFHVAIEDIEPEITPDKTDAPVASVKVVLGQAASDETIHNVEPVKEVHIAVTEQKSSKNDSSEERIGQNVKVRQFLAEKWGLSPEQIALQWKESS